MNFNIIIHSETEIGVGQSMIKLDNLLEKSGETFPLEIKLTTSQHPMVDKADHQEQRKKHLIALKESRSKHNNGVYYVLHVHEALIPGRGYEG